MATADGTQLKRKVVRSYLMAKINAEHATAGKYHLETDYDRENGRWEWWAKRIKPNNVPEFTALQLL